MEMDGDKDAAVTKKIEKKDKRKKKREAKAVADLVKDDQRNKMEKKRKKDKRKAENYTGKSEDKESKRGVTDCTEPMPNLEDGNRYDKMENKEKKRKKKTEVGYETNKKKILGKEFAEVVDNYESENNEKKKKKDKRKTEVGSETNTSESFEKIRDRTEKKKKKKVRKKADNMGKGESTAAEYDEKTSKAEISEKAEKKRKREKNNDEATTAEYVEKISKADSEKVEKKRKREKNNGKKCRDGEKITHSTKKRFVGNETKGDKMSNDQDANAVENNSKDSKQKKKKVSFSDHNEVFPLEGGIVQGKRFSPEEDKMVKQAVFDYINAHGLGDEGLTMVLHCKSHPKVKSCWKEIGQALPYRPYKSVYDRAHSLFERDQTRRWSSEELEIVRKYHAEHGSKWKQLADGMGKHRRHVKDAWRRTKLPDRKKGHWSQEEYQALFDLVNVDLRAKVNEEKKSKHGMLKDNISWMAISDSLASRSNVSCCKKWYDQLTSSMVKEGEWADTDDYHLIDALYTLDACCIEDVDWDSLLEYRSGDLCRKRWKQMANHIGENGVKPFVEKVEILSKRYCAELLEAREIWDNKPRVP